MSTAQKLTKAAFECSGGSRNTPPLVVDPFAGGGSIPLEALRLGADAFASDLNPIATLLNKVLLEYLPKYGSSLASQLSEWARKVHEDASKTLGGYYPNDQDGAVPIAYLWARTITCEGPNCGYKLPLIRTCVLDRTNRLELSANKAKRSFDVLLTTESNQRVKETVANGSATCPHCGYTTSAASVRHQLSSQGGGAKDATLLAVYVESESGRTFREAEHADIEAVERARLQYERIVASLPDAPINPIRPYKNTRGLSAVTRVGMDSFLKLYTPRQALALNAFMNAVERLANSTKLLETEEGRAIYTLLSLAAGRLVHQNSSLSRWQNNRSTIAGAFSKQALQITWDFAEGNPISSGAGSWFGAIDWIQRVIERNVTIKRTATTANCPAKHCPLPDDVADAIITDPPYFAAIPYSDLSDFFYVWMAPVLKHAHPELFKSATVDQAEEAIVTNAHTCANGKTKDSHYYTAEMTKSLSKARLICKPAGIAVVVFADSSTDSWESILQAVISGGWMITASWPLDTELQSRTQASNAASLQSSIHLVCRPRKSEAETVGDWRDVLRALPQRIHSWMPKLASEGVVGADAIFACLGPALEIFSAYETVERASGEKVPLKEYLQEVWAAVSKEALNMVFRGADASGFEEDSRLTAMWLWTLSTATDGNGENRVEVIASTGYRLEFDAARKIAMGLGAHLERLQNLVEVKGDSARLLPVSERVPYLFGKEGASVPKGRKKKDSQTKMAFLAEIEEAEQKSQFEGGLVYSPGSTVLDQLHQSMVLFAAGRGDALKRFLVEEGIGRDQRFWKLAQALSALYPKNVDEKRWVDGVLAKKKGFGL